jgi:hypothetical protein
MDLVTCVALSTVVVYTLVDRCHLSPLSPTLTALCLCLAQYFTVKFYRIYHYPRYLSPLRGVPGPKVCVGGKWLLGDTGFSVQIKRRGTDSRFDRTTISSSAKRTTFTTPVLPRRISHG